MAPHISSSQPAEASARPTRVAYLAWTLLAIVFAAAYASGSNFASTKDSATLWGALIGVAAFLAWLAVDMGESDVDGESAHIKAE